MWWDRKPDPENYRAPAGVLQPDQSRTLLLYKRDSCGYCRRVYRAVDSLGMELPMKDTQFDGQARAELQQATGRTQVPCLFIDGEPLFESADIIAWLNAYAFHVLNAS